MSSSLRLVAVLKPKEYTITYSPNGFPVTDMPNPLKVTKIENKALTLPSAPRRTGYKFMGWSRNTEEITPDEKDSQVYAANWSFKENAGGTLHAVWRKYTDWRVYNYFDNGYTARYYHSHSLGNNDFSNMAINDYMKAVGERYEYLFSLTVDSQNLNRKGATYFQSAIDICKGTTNNINLNTLCSEKNPRCNSNHTSRDNVRANFANSRPITGSSKHANVLWSAHKITGDTGDNRSFANLNSNSAYIIKNNHTEAKDALRRGQSSKTILMHELSHLIGAPDHYHEAHPDGGCKREKRYRDSGYCSSTSCNTANNTKPRPNTCLMASESYLSTHDIAFNDVLCPGCRNDILPHLRAYN